jgi:hypothetical protein
MLSAQHGRELSVSLAASHQALAEARGRVAAYEAHVSIARGRAGVLVDELEGLGDRLSELETWLATAPGQPEPASTAADTRAEP